MNDQSGSGVGRGDSNSTPFLWLTSVLAPLGSIFLPASVAITTSSVVLVLLSFIAGTFGWLLIMGAITAPYEVEQNTDEVTNGY